MLNKLMFKARKEIICFIGDSKYITSNELESIRSLSIKTGITYSHVIEMIHKFESIGLLKLERFNRLGEIGRYYIKPVLTVKGVYIYHQIKEIEGHLK